jgi:hypothetical protein
MLRYDFPAKWATQTGASIVNEIIRLLSSNQPEKYLAGLYITYRLTKIFEYKRQNDKKPFILAMQQILPILYNMFTQLLPVAGKESCMFQKLILKIFYCLVQVRSFSDILICFFLVFVESGHFHGRKFSRMVRSVHWYHQS